MNEIANTTEDLIRFHTTQDKPDEIDKCIAYIKAFFGETVQIEELENKGVKSLYISYNGNTTPTLLLNGHIDVVPGDDTQFTSKKDGEKLYGRGSIDMKGGVAIGLHLIRNYAEKKPPIALLLTSDEETGGAEGMGYCVAQGKKGELVLALEASKELGGELNTNPNELAIVNAEKGVLWVKITATGKATHASMPWTGENALDKLINAYQNIKKLFPDTTEDNRWQATMNLGKMQGGDAANKVPDHAEMILDIRWTDERPGTAIIEEIQNIPDIEVHVIENESAVNTDEQHPLLQQLKTSIEKTTQQPCTFVKSHGASDIRYAAAKGMAAIMFGPVGANLHGKEEYLHLPSLELTYNCLAHFIEQL